MDMGQTRRNSGRASSLLPRPTGVFTPPSSHACVDTWGSNMAQQINAWGPLLPLDAGRTLALYPACFDRPVPNTSSSWDWKELRAAAKRGERYPQMPTTLVALASRSSEVRPVLWVV